MRILKIPVNFAVTDLSLLMKCKTKQMVAAFLVCVNGHSGGEERRSLSCWGDAPFSWSLRSIML